MNKKTVVGIIGVIAIATAVPFMWLQQSVPLINLGDESDSPAGAPFPSTAQVGYMEYSSEKYKFKVTYPAELGQVTDYDEGNGARTIVFEGGEGGRGFQIFVRPFTKKRIGRDDFMQDNPSGIMNDPVDVIIDRERATTFYSMADELGETREVWFIHDGYLYEVLTKKEWDAYLSHIMSTWKFI